MDSYGGQSQFPVRNCFSMALCWARMVEMTAGDTGESSVEHFTTTPFQSCRPYAAVSHFQFLYLVCVCGSARLCVFAGTLQKEKGPLLWSYFSFTVINHQRITWLFQLKINFHLKKIHFIATFPCKSHMKAQQNMVSALLPVVPNTHSGCSTAYYASVWIDTQRWYMPAALPAAGLKNCWGKKLGSGTEELLSELII